VEGAGKPLYDATDCACGVTTGRKLTLLKAWAERRPAGRTLCPVPAGGVADLPDYMRTHMAKSRDLSLTAGQAEELTSVVDPEEEPIAGRIYASVSADGRRWANYEGPLE